MKKFIYFTDTGGRRHVVRTKNILTMSVERHFGFNEYSEVFELSVKSMDKVSTYWLSLDSGDSLARMLYDLE